MSDEAAIAPPAGARPPIANPAPLEMPLADDPAAETQEYQRYRT